MTSSSTPTPPGPVRLLTLPARHPYVDAVRPASARTVRPERVTGWEPDPFYAPETVAALADEVDVVHLHFGFDHLDEPALDAWLTALRAAGLPLVVTLHDLRNPHHRQAGPHEALLARLLPAAAAVTTLTAGAAAEATARYGVMPTVVPHPTLARPARSAAVAPEPGRVVLHLKSLRRNLVEPLAVATAAVEGARRGGGRLVVDLHPEVVDDPRLAGLAELARRPEVELQVHPRYSDEQLERYLRRAHVTVLPHRWGTHSGWLELARDLGTRVVAPSCGYYRDQWADVVTYRHDERHGLDAADLADAVARALATPPPPPADRAARLAEREQGRAAHAAIYARVCAAVAVAG